MVKKLIKDAQMAFKMMEEAGSIVKEQEKSVDQTRRDIVIMIEKLVES